MLYRRLLSYVGASGWKVVAGLVLAGVSSLASIGYAGAMPFLVRAVTAKAPGILILVLLGILGLNIIRNGSSYFSGYLLTSVGQRVVARIRAEYFERVQRLPLQVFDRWRAGELMSRFSNECAMMVVGVSQLPLFCIAVLTLIGGVGYMLYLDWQLTLMSFLLGPLVAVAVSRFSGMLHRFTQNALSRIADLNATLQETLDSMRVIKAFHREDYEISRFRDRNEAYVGAQMKVFQISLTQTPVVDFIIVVGVLCLAGFAAFEFVLGRKSAEEMLSFFALVAVVGNPINQLSNYYADIIKALTSAQRVFEILDLPVEEPDVAGARVLGRIEGAVEFEDVTFAYDGGPAVLKGISAAIEPGDTVALVGPSGSGKTTMVNLIPRFYVPTSGRMLVDGVDTRSVTLTSLRSAIAVVPQDPLLFSDTIEQNIRYGRLDATDEEVREAARLANAQQFVEGLPQGYKTTVGARGMRLSGGERQRIAIARAILRDPRILILDEATSSLDAESEALIGEALERLLVGRTTFIIAHRLSTIRRANVILVLDDGKLVERGTHAELLAHGGLYARLYERQMLEPAVEAT